jgi:hypothetical protein
MLKDTCGDMPEHKHIPCALTHRMYKESIPLPFCSPFVYIFIIIIIIITLMYLKKVLSPLVIFYNNYFIIIIIIIIIICSHFGN